MIIAVFRRFLFIVNTLSVLVLVATVAVWTRSEFVYDRISASSSTADWFVHVGHGEVVAVSYENAQLERSLSWETGPPDQPAPNITVVSPSTTLPTTNASLTGSYTVIHSVSITYRTYLSFPGFSWSRATGSALSGFYIRARLWLITVLAGVLPTVVGGRWLLHRRQQNPNQCPECGYDLRATPDRCPECGLVPASPQ